jgi:hypothetical protein
MVVLDALKESKSFSSVQNLQYHSKATREQNIT